LATLTVTGRKRAKRFIWSEELHRWVKIFLEKVDRVRNEVIIDCPDRNIRITFVPGEEWAMVKGTIKGQSRIDPRFGGKIAIDPGQEKINPGKHVYQEMAQWAWEILIAPRIVEKGGE